MLTLREKSHTKRSLPPAAAWLVLVAALAPAGVGAAPKPSVDVAMKTPLGTIVVRLDAEHAPKTTANFLHYVDTQAYEGATFYRFVPRRARGGGRVTISVIQGGLQTKLGDSGIEKLPTVVLEPTSQTGLSNTNGTIAMARDAAPNTASSEFFINIGDNSVLDAQKFKDHHGYAVFGRVVSGMTVVKAIAAAPTRPDPAMTALLTPPIPIVSMRQL